MDRVGAEAVLLGVSKFLSDSRAVESSLVGLGITTSRLSSVTRASWGAASGAVVAGSAIITAAITGVAAATAAAGVAVIGMGAQYQETLAQMAAAAEQPIDRMDEMSETILNVSTTTTQSADKVAESANQLVRAGLTMADVYDGAAESIANFTMATGGEIGLERATLTVAGAMKAFGLSGKEADRVVNSLVAVGIKSAITFGDLDQSMRQAMHTTALMGYTVEDTAAVIGVLGQSGLKGARGGTSLKQMFLQLMNPSKKALEMMKQYGISLYDATGKALPLRAVLEQLETAFGDEAVATGKLTQMQRDNALATIFESDGIKAAIVLATRGVSAYDEMKEAMKGLTAEQVAQAATQRVLNPQLKIFANNLEAIAIRAGREVEPALATAVASVNKLLRSLNPEIPKLFGKALLAVASGQRLEEVFAGSEKIFSGTLDYVFKGWVAILIAIRDAITKDLMPSLTVLARAFGGTKGITIEFGQAMFSLAGTIRTISGAVSTIINIFTTLVKAIQQSTFGMQALNIVMSSINLMPLVAIAPLMITIGLAMGRVLLIATALTLGIYAVGRAYEYISSNWERYTGTLAAGMLMVVRQLSSVFIEIGKGWTFITSTMSKALATPEAHLLELAAGLYLVFSTLGLFIARLPQIVMWFELLAGDIYLVSLQVRVVTGAIQTWVLGNAALVGSLIKVAATTVYLSVSALGQLIINLARVAAQAVATAAMMVYLTVQTLAYNVATKIVAAGGIIGLIASLARLAAAFATTAAVAAASAIIMVARWTPVIALGSLYATAALTISLANALIAGSFGPAIVAAGQWVIAIVAAAMSSLYFVTTGMVPVITSIPRVVAGLAAMSVAFLQAGLAAARSAVVTVQAWAVSTVTALVSGIRTIIANLLVLIATWGATALAAVRSAASTVAAWAVMAVQAIAGAVVAFVTALAPFLVGLAAIAGAAYLLYTAWKNNWLGCQDIVNTVINWIGDRVAEFLNWLNSIPLLKGLVGGVTEAFNTATREIPKYVDKAGSVVNEIASQVSKLWQQVRGEVAATNPELDEMIAKLQAVIALQRRGTKGMGELKRVESEMPDTYTKPPEMPDYEPGFLPDTGDGLSKKERLIKQIMADLKDLPAMRRELAEFLADLEEETPGRLGGMEAALLGAKEQLIQLVVLKRQMLMTDQAIAEVEAQIAMTNAQLGVINARQNAMQLGYQQKLNALREQSLAVEQQMWPIQDRIKKIDQQIAKLQRENLDLAKQRTQAELAMLPIKEKIAAIDKKIEETNKRNFEVEIALAQTALDQLPYKQAIAAIEKQIENVVNKRLALEQKEAQLKADRTVTLLDRELRSANKQLDEAWANMDVGQILKLEDLVDSLTNQKSAAEETATAVKEQIEDTEYYNSITQIGLEKEKLLYEELLKPMQDKADALQNEIDLQAAKNEVLKLGFEQEKAVLEELLQPYQDIIDKITVAQEAERLRNQLLIYDLEAEKRILEDQLEPLQALKDAIDRQTATVQLQLDLENLKFEREKAILQEQLANEQIRRADLELTRLQQEAVFTSLVLGYAKGLEATGAFTTGEALETAKRLGLWNQQLAKLGEIEAEFIRLTGEANKFHQAIDDIPTEKHVYIITHYVNAGEQPKSFAQGGVVPGPKGDPVLVIAHGGERFLGINNTTPAPLQYLPPIRNDTATPAGSSVTYQVQATYKNVESPANIGMDLRALVAMSKR